MLVGLPKVMEELFGGMTMTVLHETNGMNTASATRGDVGRYWGTTFDTRPVGITTTQAAAGAGGRGRFARALEPSRDGRPPKLILSGPRPAWTICPVPTAEIEQLLGNDRDTHAGEWPMSAVPTVNPAEPATAGARGSKQRVEQSPKGTPVLTRREREIATLVASGYTNRSIADQLFIARSTVERHIANILSKFGFSSRTQIATWVVTSRLSGA